MMNNKGVTLIMVLWVLLVLSLMAWSLSRRSSLEVSLLSNYRGKLRGYASARAEISRILDLLQKSPSPKDTLYASGILIDPAKTPQDVFSHVDTGGGAYAVVRWQAHNYNDSQPLAYGLRDEGGRININAISTNNYQILSALFQLKGLSQSDADALALSVVNYMGGISQASGRNSSFSQDDSFLKPKRKHFENILELLEVNGMSREIFDQIKDDVTVYGSTKDGLWINVDTANNDVIQAVAHAAARVNPAANADNIINEACAIRDGADSQSFTVDDGAASIAGTDDANWPPVLQEGTSGYYRARVAGVDPDSGARTVVEAVIRRLPGEAAKIIAWQRD
ncbi:MAG: general secretion pathway protein GspK [Candidatus Omnitrophica bacterium]|nr:general secretion pathway protein GspK [Candidatus Omnitrophota bacterium]MDE2222932.1 general secretion pathway protein GspK [Candidatus Omnitrophota bacterium]